MSTTVNPTSDATLYLSTPDTNTSTNTYIDIGESNAGANLVGRTVLIFDLTSIPSNANVQSATLRLYKYADYSDNARVFSVYRLLHSWTPATVTWNNRNGGTTWDTAGAMGAADCEASSIGDLSLTASEDDGYKEWALTASKVQEWISGALTNNGILVKPATETNDRYRFYSKDNASNKPELIIYWTVGGNKVVWIG
jgi:hypothetical protein